jgi:hypothetical protein
MPRTHAAEDARRNGKDGERRTLRPPLPDQLAADAEPGDLFTLANVGRDGYRLSLLAPTLLVALGTTGCKVVDGTVERLVCELGEPLPDSVNYLLIDADAPPAGADPDHFVPLPGTGAGAGTDQRAGLRLFRQPGTREAVHAFLDHAVAALQSCSCPELSPAHSAQEILNVTVVAGPGGTSSGVVHDLIGLVHDVAQARKVRHPLVHLVAIGAEMPLRDRTRSTYPEQEQAVRANAATVLCRVAADMITDGFLDETRPDGSTFRVAAGSRVFSLLLADQDNGSRQCATTDGLVGVLRNALFLRLFTRVGAHLAARIKDPDEQGVMLRGRLP